MKRVGPTEPAPVYQDFSWLDGLLFKFFRAKVVDQLGYDNNMPGFEGLIDLIRRLNAANDDKTKAHLASRNILKSLFPSWLPGSFAVLFSKPLPAFSSRMNAYITQLTTYWLMGESELNDIEVDGGGIGKGQGLLVKRCRYLEEAGCASVCVNTCKVPTQDFFMLDMGLPLTMTPNYTDFSCQFSFGLTPPLPSKDPSFDVPCFAQCPTASKNKPTCYQIQLPPPSQPSR